MDQRSHQQPAEPSAVPARANAPVRKPPAMRWESFADRLIREAHAAGEFENLPGFGRPIPGIDAPPDENWWIKRKLRDEGLSVVPPVLQARREIERTRAAIAQLDDEAEVRRRLEQMNVLIRQAMYSPVPGPSDGVMPMDIERELQVWRQGRSQEGGRTAG